MFSRHPVPSAPRRSPRGVRGPLPRGSVERMFLAQDWIHAGEDEAPALEGMAEIHLLQREAQPALEPNDVITSVDGRPVKNPAELRAVVTRKAAGTELTLEVHEGPVVHEGRHHCIIAQWCGAKRVAILGFTRHLLEPEIFVCTGAVEGHIPEARTQRCGSGCVDRLCT